MIFMICIIFIICLSLEPKLPISVGKGIVLERERPSKTEVMAGL